MRQSAGNKVARARPKRPDVSTPAKKTQHKAAQKSSPGTSSDHPPSSEPETMRRAEPVPESCDETQSYCGNCGTKLADSDAYCPECGERSGGTAPSTQVSPRRPRTADSFKTEPAMISEMAAWVTQMDKRLLIYLGLMVLGLFGMMAGQGGPFIIILGIGAVLFITRAIEMRWHILGRDEIIDQWDALIGNAAGEEKHIVEETERLLALTKAPGVKWDLRKISPGRVRGLLGVWRSSLVVENTSNPNLGPYRMYIHARDYGTNLQVSWYLARQPSLWQKLVMLSFFIPILGVFILPLHFIGRLFRARQAGVLGLDLFDEEDLRAYVTNAHHCLLEAVNRLMLSLSQDPSMINRCSRGFLGIS